MTLTRILKWFGVFFSILFFFLFLTLLFIWTWPGLVIHETNLLRLKSFFFPKVQLSWQTLKLDAESRSFFRKSVRLDAKDLCVGEQSPEWSVCFTEVGTSLEAVLGFRQITYHLGNTRLLGGKIIYRSVGSRAVSSEPESEFEWSKLFEKIKVSAFTLGVDSFLFQEAENSVMGRIALDAVPQKRALRFRLKGDGSLVDRSEWREMEQKAAGSGNLERRAAGSGNLERRAVGREPRRKVAIDFQGDFSQGQLLGSVTAAAEHWQSSLPKVRLNQCRLNLSLSQLNFLCPTEVSVKLPLKTPRRERFSGVLVIKARRNEKTKASGSNTIAGNLSWEVYPLLRKVREGRLKLTSTFEGSAAHFPKRLQFDASLTGEIEDFRRITWALRRSAWGIPEPLNSLKGPLRFQANGKGSFGFDKGFRLPFKLETRLSSIRQKLIVDGEGEWLLNDTEGAIQNHLNLKLNLSEIRIVLPHLEAQTPPRLAPDRRIQLTPEVSRDIAKVPSFTYHIELASDIEHPIHLVSNLAKADIPVHLSMDLQSGKPARGEVRLGQFPVELFRRTAFVDRFEMRIADKPEEREVNGRITVAYTDYTVRILILGVASEPTIKFVSEPPLPEDQVVAVLLFGKPMKELDSDQTLSVDSARAAFAQSAMSLASMYLLASTPVESVSYDQATGVFAAKIRLGDGTSLNLGSDARQLSQLGIRKRLGPDWTVTTYLTNPFDPIERSLTAFLEWSKGY